MLRAKVKASPEKDQQTSQDFRVSRIHRPVDHDNCENNSSGKLTIEFLTTDENRNLVDRNGEQENRPNHHLSWRIVNSVIAHAYQIVRDVPQHEMGSAVMRFGYMESPLGYYQYRAFSPAIRQMICICKYGDRALRIGLTPGNLICKPSYEYSNAYVVTTCDYFTFSKIFFNLAQ